MCSYFLQNSKPNQTSATSSQPKPREPNSSVWTTNRSSDKKRVATSGRTMIDIKQHEERNERAGNQESTMVSWKAVV